MWEDVSGLTSCFLVSVGICLLVSLSMMTRQRGARAEKLSSEEQEESEDPLEALGNLRSLWYLQH